MMIDELDSGQIIIIIFCAGDDNHNITSMICALKIHLAESTTISLYNKIIDDPGRAFNCNIFD